MVEFKFPDYYDFPPFFTIQPVRSTREKQLELWKQLVLDWHKCHDQSSLSISQDAEQSSTSSSSSLFHNAKLQRTLSIEGRRIVCDSIIASGNGEWEDLATKSRLRIYWKKPSIYAAEIYDFATSHGMINNVYTVYELHSGDETVGSSFHGLEPWLIRKALATLEASDKVAIFKGETSDEDGVKFL